ncbi:MAG: alkaline phosphatase D family protein [Bacteroidetes bacterium]|nr:alkaline phosphatase D family protein [Bacteroidota bacterium]
MHLKPLKIFLILGLILVPLIGNAQKLVSKPFVGAKDHQSVKVWCLFKKADTIHFTIEDEQQKIIATQSKIFNKKEAFKQYFPIILNFENLTPNTKYTIQYLINHQKHELIQLQTEDDAIQNFSFLTGSCAFVGTSFNRMVKPFNNLKILESMAQDSANYMLWLGDNIYYIFEKNSPKRQLKRNIQVRLNKKMSTFLNSKEQYAIWDDHDYGSNNSGADFKHKNSSLNVFQQFWPNPIHEQLNYYTFQKEDVQFFMLDDRFYKDDTLALGRQQLDWLIYHLRQSDATFKIIAIGTQALNKSGTHECLYNAKEEFDKLMLSINQYKINGIFFITGDRHFAELVKMDSIIGYPLHDFTTSPISMYPLKKKASEIMSNPNIEGTYYNKNNYAKISFSGIGQDRKCIISLKGRNGETIWNYTILVKELQY